MNNIFLIFFSDKTLNPEGHCIKLNETRGKNYYKLWIIFSYLIKLKFYFKNSVFQSK